MATTTNYSWTTPDDTALVKDGASAIRTLGTSIDTTTKNLNPSTTLGDIEYRSSSANTNTRLGIGSSGQGLQVVAGVPAWAASSTSTLTTTGDLLYASAANTLARRAIGSTGDVLTVSGGLPTWATPTSGSYTLLSTTSITSTSTTVSSISQSYQDLFIEIYGITFSTTDSTPWITINASGSSTVRAFLNTYTSKTGSPDLYGGGTDWLRTSANNYFGLQIRNYTTTDRYKSLVSAGVTTDTASTLQPYGWTGAYTANTAISQISINIGGGRTFSTGTIKVWGIK